jgi:hypothetical protein
MNHFIGQENKGNHALSNDAHEIIHMTLHILTKKMPLILVGDLRGFGFIYKKILKVHVIYNLKDKIQTIPQFETLI